MLHLSRVLLFTVLLVATLYGVIELHGTYATLIMTLLIIMTVLAFVRALSSEYDADNPHPRSVHTEPRASGREVH